MEKIRRLLLGKVLLAALCVLGITVFLPHGYAQAGIVTYRYVDGTPVTKPDGTPVSTNNATTTTFADVTAVVSANRIIAYVDNSDYFKGVFSPAEPFLMDGGEVTVVTNDMVTDGGKIGTKGVSWFIYGSNLYIVSTQGGAVLAEESDSAPYRGKYNRTINFNGDAFYVKSPAMEKGNIETDGYGMRPSAVGDEITLNEDEYYKYVDNTNTQKSMSTTPGESISLNQSHYSALSKVDKVLDAGKLPWINYAGSIRNAYFGTNITVSGNVAQMFNGRTTDSAGARYPALLIGNVKESLYENLENVYIYSDFSNVTSTAAMFARCPKLRNVAAYAADGHDRDVFDLKKNDTAAFMFYGDRLLNNSDTASIINTMDMSGGMLENTMYMYAGCENISNPNLSKFNMSNVENIDGMFQGTTNAQVTFASGSNASVGSWDVSKVKTAQCTFAGVIPSEGGVPNYDVPNHKLSPGLGEIPTNSVVTGIADLSKWNLASCVSAYAMFAQNLGVTGVNFAASYPALLNATSMFNGADNLASVSMHGTGMPVLANADAMFRRAGKASGGTADLSGWSAPALVNTNLMFESCGYTSVNMDTAAGTTMSNVTESIAMFADCPRLTNVGSNGLSHLRLTKAVDTRYMFDGDTALTKVDVTNWGMDAVKNISHMFADCEALPAINSKSWKTGALTDMECFAYNSGISSASMEDWDTTKTTSMYMAFARSDNLETATLPKKTGAFAKVEDTNGMFAFCPRLTTVSGSDSNKYRAPELEDARGMFAFCPKLTSAGVDNLVQDSASTIAYMFRGDEDLTSFSMAGWDTTGTNYMQGLFDGCVKLASLTTGNNVKSDVLKSMAVMFRDCHKLGNDINTVIAKFTTNALLEDMYESFRDCYALTKLDLSPMNLSHVKNLIHLAYMAEEDGIVTNKLTTIVLPPTILTASDLITSDASDGHGSSINMFWVDGDGAVDGSYEEEKSEDDLLTTLIVNGELPARLKTYDFGGTSGDNDNRTFITYKGRTINDADVGTYTFKSPTDTAKLKMNVTSSLYKNGRTAESATNIKPVFEWQKDGASLPGMTDTYTTAANAAGVYRSTAMPGELTGSNGETQVTYLLTAVPVVEKKIEATYTGPNIVKGQNYSKDNVTVVYTDSSGTQHTLTKNDWTVDSLTVTKVGDNTYTVTYNPGDGALTDTITVTGVAAGEAFLSAVYVGEPVAVSSNYAKSDVLVLYTDAEGHTTTVSENDFIVDSLKVTKKGDNTFTASYTPEGGSKVTDTFVVEGFQNEAGLSAVYTGGTVPVGSNYKKEDVKVTLTLEDGTVVTLTPNDFTVDSQKVTKKGDNTFTATYKAGDKTYTATFTVPGKRLIGSITAVYTGPAVLVGNEYDPSFVTVTAYYVDDTSKSEGFEVTPTSFSTKKVSNVGDNTIKATYKDPEQDDKVFSAPFKVNGYKEVSSIGANYTGGKIKVGDSYKKKDVKLTLYYADGTTGTTENFTVDSLVVTGEGSNSYTATYRDPFGNTYTAGYTVPGYKKSSDDDDDKKKDHVYYPPGTAGSEYAGVSSVFPGTGYAASVPAWPGGVGVSSGLVQTGTTVKAWLYAIGGIILVLALAVVVIIRIRHSRREQEES